MNECPDHPVRKHLRFFGLMQSRVDNTWQVKILGAPTRDTASAYRSMAGYLELIYGETVQEALDNALIHLMNDALWENP